MGKGIHKNKYKTKIQRGGDDEVTPISIFRESHRQTIPQPIQRDRSNDKRGA